MYVCMYNIYKIFICIRNRKSNKTKEKMSITFPVSLKASKLPNFFRRLFDHRTSFRKFTERKFREKTWQLV